MSKIVAVVLTYNRKDLLARCLMAIDAQTRPCDAIVVIDNASTDGTEQMVLEMGLANLHTYVLSRNLGAAGGFNAGFRLAYQLGADFVWMMDDDVIPSDDALQQLLAADERLAQRQLPRSFLLSCAYTEKGLVNNAPSLDQRRNAIAYESWPAAIEMGVAPICRGTFVSILMPRATLAEHGLPIASMFIWGEDTEYTLRVTRQVPGYLVGASKVLHLRGEGGGALDIRTEKSPARIRYHRHFMRNELFITRQYRKRRNVLQILLQRTSGMLKLLARGQFLKASVVLRGVCEGVFFNPRFESADASLESLGVEIRVAAQQVEVPVPQPALPEQQPVFLQPELVAAQ